MQDYAELCRIVQKMEQEINKKLKDEGYCLEDLAEMGIGAIVCVPCPTCKKDIFYTLHDEYYDFYKRKEPIPMLLYCKNCHHYQPEVDLVNGELLYENEGILVLRKIIPFVERLPDLPEKKS